MQSTPDAYDPAAIEEATRQFWKSRGLPPANGSVGPPTGARIHQIIGTIASDANPVALTQGGVLADVDARYFALTGRRTVGRLLVRPSRDQTPDPRTPALLEAAGAWSGGAGSAPRDPVHDGDRLQRMVERLAASGILVRLENPLRSCPRCRVPRTLAGILYHEEEGPAYLVRFPLAGATPPVSVVVWTDAAWKLLGAPAVLAQGDAPYVIVRYRRRGSEERVLVAKSSLPHLQAWLPGGDWEVVEELPGASLEGRAYDHPLGTESPMLGRPPAPSGQIHLSSEVTDSGTGFVALVPAHGAADAAASRTLDLPGWPVLDHDMSLTSSFRHKYQGLPVEAGEAFVVRDLREGGYLFAELTVRRGVPRCAVCRTALVWETGSAWCLVPAALPPARLDLFARLVPGERSPPSTEVVPWPVTGGELVDDPLVPSLRECGTCHRLSAPGAGATCFCGGTTQAHRRRLLPVFREALLAWADESPFPPGEAAILYLPARRRVPTLIHHLVAMEAADAHPGSLTIHSLATLPQGQSLDEWLVASPRDAARAALVSLTETPRGGAPALVERRAQQAHRLRRFWALAQTVANVARADRSLGGMPPIASRYPELLDEDRALLSRFERARREVIAAYEAGDAAAASRLLEQFFDGPLRSIYLPAAGRRLAGSPAERGPVLALLIHVLVTWSELYGPIAPFTTEAVSRLFVADGRSLFERSITPILETALDPALEERSTSWWAIVEATRRARRHLGIADAVEIPQVVLGARDEKQAAEVRAASDVIGRLINARHVAVASAQLPWSGRTLQITPILPALQKVFGAGAPRVARILQGLPPPRVRDGIRSKTLEIAVEGRPVPISAAMVEIVEQLPDGFLSFPWAGGELIVQAPGATAQGTSDRPRVLSSDAYKVVRRARQRIRWSDRPEGVRVVVVCATGTLSEELVRLAPSLATTLGVPLFRLVGSTDGFPLSETTTGRTGRGAPWAIWVPGSRRPDPRVKERATQARLDRIRRAIRRDPTPEVTVEIQSEPSVRRDAEIERWVVRLDELVGRPLVGPAKLRAAWDAGLQQYDDLIHAPYERLAAIAGFGPVVAAEVVARAGGKVPPKQRPPIPPTRAWPVARRAAPPARSVPASHPIPAPPPAVEGTEGGPSRVGPPGDRLARALLDPEASVEPAATDGAGDSVPSGLLPVDHVGPELPGGADVLGGAGTTMDSVDLPGRGSESPGPGDDATGPPPDDRAEASGPPSTIPEPVDSVPDGAPVGEMGPERAVDPPGILEPGPEPATDGPVGGSNSGETPPSRATVAELIAPPAQSLEPAATSRAEGVAVHAGRVASEGDPDTPGIPPSAELVPTAEGSASAFPRPADAAPSEPLPLSAPALMDISEPPGASLPTGEPERTPETEGRASAPELVIAAGEAGRGLETRTEPRDGGTTVPPAGPDQVLGADPVIEVAAPPTSRLNSQPASSPPDVDPRQSSDVVDAQPLVTVTPPEQLDADPMSKDPIAPPADDELTPALPAPPDLGSVAQPVGDAPSETPSALGQNPTPPALAASSESENTGIAESNMEHDSGGDPLLEPLERASPAPGAAEPVDVSASPVTGRIEPLTVEPIGTGPTATPPNVAEPAQLLANSPPPVPSPAAGPDVASGPEVAAPRLEAVVPAPAPPASPPPPAAGLAVSSAAVTNDAWPLFLDATGAGHRGLCISREFPDRMRALLGPRDVTIVWLSNSTRAGSVRPSDLEGLAQAVEKAVVGEHVRAIYLDHVEYLARVNTPEAVRTLLERLDAVARAHEARAWVALNPSLLAVDAAEVLTRGFATAH